MDVPRVRDGTEDRDIDVASNDDVRQFEVRQRPAEVEKAFDPLDSVLNDVSGVFDLVFDRVLNAVEQVCDAVFRVLDRVRDKGFDVLERASHALSNRVDDGFDV